MSEVEFQLSAASTSLLNFAAEMRTDEKRPILDAGCGYGRNAAALAVRGFSVVCVDKRQECLESISRLPPSEYLIDPRISGGAVGKIYPLLVDLGPSRWPFRENCFAGIVCVHFLNVALFQVFHSSLITGGHLYLETFGGHGGNYLDLPRAGQLRELLWTDFELLSYKEKKVGPVGYDATTVRLFARKRPQATDSGARSY